ncbi:MAG: hypothetical protein OSB62_08855, partial [Alphaproteobacteria bacterium]|nr:hypothetical protein [Alphaproteobacteria bacterium]
AYPFWKTLQLLLWSFKLIVWRIHDFGFTAKWLIALYFLIAIIFGGASEATTIVMDLFMGMLVAFPFVMLFFMSSKEGSSKYECVDDGEVQPTKFILVMAWLMVMITLASNLFSFVGEGL